MRNVDLVGPRNVQFGKRVLAATLWRVFGAVAMVTSVDFLPDVACLGASVPGVLELGPGFGTETIA
jgi:hypothetical protein